MYLHTLNRWIFLFLSSVIHMPSLYFGLDAVYLFSMSLFDFLVHFLKCSKSLEQQQMFCCRCGLGQGHTE